MNALDNMSTEELITTLKKIGSVQIESISIKVSPVRFPKINFAIQEGSEIVVEKELKMMASPQYKFDFPEMRIVPKQEKAA